MKLYIGNVPYSTSEEELRSALAEFEPFKDFYYPMDRDTGQPRGFAFVTVSSREIGEELIRVLDGTEIGGRELRVREAEERPRNQGGGGGGGRGGYGGGGGGRGRDERGGGGRGGRDNRGGGRGGRGGRGGGRYDD